MKVTLTPTQFIDLRTLIKTEIHLVEQWVLDYEEEYLYRTKHHTAKGLEPLADSIVKHKDTLSSLRTLLEAINKAETE